MFTTQIVRQKHCPGPSALASLQPWDLEGPHLPSRADPQSLRVTGLRGPLRTRRAASRAQTARLQNLQRGWRVSQCSGCPPRRRGKETADGGAFPSGARNLLCIAHPFGAPARRSLRAPRDARPPSLPAGPRGEFRTRPSGRLPVPTSPGSTASRATAEGKGPGQDPCTPGFLPAGANPGNTLKYLKCLSLTPSIQELASFSIKRQIANILGFAGQDQSLWRIWLFFNNLIKM